MKHEDKSDFEANKGIAEALGMITEGGNPSIPSVVYAGLTGAGDLRPRDWCNSWIEVGPLAWEHGISLINDNGVKCATTNAQETFEPFGSQFYEVDVENDNPTRAAAVCLLYVLEGER